MRSDRTATFGLVSARSWSVAGASAMSSAGVVPERITATSSTTGSGESPSG